MYFNLGKYTGMEKKGRKLKSFVLFYFPETTQLSHYYGT